MHGSVCARAREDAGAHHSPRSGVASESLEAIFEYRSRLGLNRASGASEEVSVIPLTTFPPTRSINRVTAFFAIPFAILPANEPLPMLASVLMSVQHTHAIGKQTRLEG